MDELDDTTDVQRRPYMSTKQRRIPAHYDQMQRHHDSGDDSACHSLGTNSYYTSNNSDESDDSSYDLDSDDSESQIICLESLRANYSYLLDQMETDRVLDKLHESSLFDDAFLEKCKETSNRRRRVDLIIKEISSIARTKTSHVLNHFALALTDDQDFILGTLMSGTYNEARAATTEMSPEHAKFMELMRERIVRDTDPKKFLHKLVENNALSLIDHEDIACLSHRKDQVQKLLSIAEENSSRSTKVIQAIIDAFPKLYRQYKSKAMKESCHSTRGAVGAAVRVKISMSSENMTEAKQQTFKEIEQRFVRNYRQEKVNDNDQVLDNLIEECRCKFEGLKISCIVIQLLALDEDSISKVVNEAKTGKIKEWFLSNLDERNVNLLNQFGDVKLEISISVEKGGNFNSQISLNDCICKLNRQLVLENKEKLKDIMDDDTLKDQFEKLYLSTSKESGQTGKGPNFMFDLFEENAVNNNACCLLEEHLKSKHPSVLECLINCRRSAVSLPTKSDIDMYKEYLIEELEIHGLMQTVKSLETETSRELLEDLENCRCRRARTARFLEFVKGEEDIVWFWDEVKSRQYYILDTILSSQNQSHLKSDLLAVKLMNDTITEEVDPDNLWQNMDEKLAEELGMTDFQHNTSRKRKAQYMLNRLSLATICDFMITLRRCGYEYLYSEIKAGSLSKDYVCPRIHKREGKGNCIFSEQFDIQMKSDGPLYPKPEYTRMVRPCLGRNTGGEFNSGLGYLPLRTSTTSDNRDEKTFQFSRHIPPCISDSPNDSKFEVLMKQYLKMDVDFSRQGVRNKLRKSKNDSLQSQRHQIEAEGKGPFIVYGDLCHGN